MELVSVIIPVYNIEDYLPRCLACIEMQTYKNLEIILVDDGSTDGSGRLCDEFAEKDSRARVIHHPENRGTWAARNTGQDAAHGEYIWMPDGDDYFHKDIIKVMHDIINKPSSSGRLFDMVIVNYRRTSRSNEDTSWDVAPDFVEITAAELLNARSHTRLMFIASAMWSKFIRSELVKDLRANAYKYAQDADYSIRIYLKEPQVAFVENELYWWVQRDSSAMRAADYLLVHKECTTRIYYNNLISIQKDENRKKYCRYLLDMLYYRMAQWAFMAQKTESEGAVNCEIRDMIRRTGFSYLICGSIKTTKKRLFLLVKLRFIKLYTRYMQIVHPKTIMRQGSECC